MKNNGVNKMFDNVFNEIQEPKVRQTKSFLINQSRDHSEDKSDGLIQETKFGD